MFRAVLFICTIVSMSISVPAFGQDDPVITQKMIKDFFIQSKIAADSMIDHPDTMFVHIDRHIADAAVIKIDNTTFVSNQEPQIQTVALTKEEYKNFLTQGVEGMLSYRVSYKILQDRIKDEGRSARVFFEQRETGTLENNVSLEEEPEPIKAASEGVCDSTIALLDSGLLQIQSLECSVSSEIILPEED